MGMSNFMTDDEAYIYGIESPRSEMPMMSVESSASSGFLPSQRFDIAESTSSYNLTPAHTYPSFNAEATQELMGSQSIDELEDPPQNEFSLVSPDNSEFHEHDQEVSTRLGASNSLSYDEKYQSYAPELGYGGSINPEFEELFHGLQYRSPVHKSDSDFGADNGNENYHEYLQLPVQQYQPSTRPFAREDAPRPQPQSSLHDHSSAQISMDVSSFGMVSTPTANKSPNVTIDQSPFNSLKPAAAQDGPEISAQIQVQRTLPVNINVVAQASTPAPSSNSATNTATSNPSVRKNKGGSKLGVPRGSYSTVISPRAKRYLNAQVAQGNISATISALQAHARHPDMGLDPNNPIHLKKIKENLRAQPWRTEKVIRRQDKIKEEKLKMTSNPTGTDPGVFTQNMTVTAITTPTQSLDPTSPSRPGTYNLDDLTLDEELDENAQDDA